MRSVCIALKKKITTEGEEERVLDAFSRVGYAFDELRILSLSARDKLFGTLLELKASCDLLVLLTDSFSLPEVRGYLAGVLQGWARVIAAENAVVYSNDKSTLFLLSVEEADDVTKIVGESCLPYLQQRFDVRCETLVLRAVGAKESEVRRVLAEVERLGQGKFALRHKRRYEEDVVEIVCDGNTPKLAVDEGLRMLMEGFGDSVYALDDVSLEEQLVHLLKLRGKRLSVAESFTGGGIAKRITSVSGASEVYFEGVNTYNEHSKEKRLGVSEYAIRTAGIVSEQTAYEMAVGLLNTGDCDVAIATTGLAGPNSDRSMLPVGLCFIAVGTQEKVLVYRYKFDGNRKSITEKAINYALFLAYKQLKNI